MSSVFAESALAPPSPQRVTLSATSLRIAATSLEYSARQLRDQFKKTPIADLSKAADAQEAAAAEILAFLKANP